MKTPKRQRFAIYTRYSSEMQNDLSLEAQEHRCRQDVAKRNGVVIDVYSDSAKSGWSLERDGFNELQRDAARNRFDAIIVWKFDRLARNHDHAVMIKALLRHEFGLKLYCVEGFSEDDDGSAYGAMMEQMIAVFSAFYSRNLSSETKRGKKQRVINGEFNGSIAPLGYDLIKLSDVKDKNHAGLYINDVIAPIITEAFEKYASGDYSDAKIAQWMNTLPEIQQLRAGQKAIGKEMVRDMLKNRVYTGRVPYAETLYSGSLGQGKRASRNRKEWFEGKHEAIITDDLYESCQLARERMVSHRRTTSKMKTYVLHDRVFCARCVITKPLTIADPNYGKMRPTSSSRDSKGWYRCIARDRGYHKCDQPSIDTNLIDDQVVEFLSSLVIPQGYRERVQQAVKQRVENEKALQRIEEIQEIVQRIDFSWERGFMTPQEYVEKRNQLNQEIEALRPVDYDDLMEAGDLIENFKVYWDGCKKLDDPEEGRKQLLRKIVKNVFVYDDKIIGITLHGDFGVILDQDKSAPVEVTNSLGKIIKKGGNITKNVSTQFGSDGT